MSFFLITCIIFMPDILAYIKGIITHSFFDNFFVIKYDWQLQHIPFYQEFFRLIDSKEIAWSWNQFLGINFYASKAYYLLADPFAWIAYFLYKFIGLSVVNGLFCVTFLKILISGIGMYAYLSSMTKDKYTNFVYSVIYMTSGWVTTFIEHPVFLSFYVLCPLLLLGTEKVLKEKKYSFVIVSSTILLSINYYFMWMFCWFLLVYWCIRYYQIHDCFQWKQFFVCSAKMLASFLVAVLISAVVWYPSLKHLLLSSRLTSSALVNFAVWDLKDFIAILRNFFIPVFKFDDVIYRSNWYYFYQIGIYCGSAQLLLLPQLLTIKDKKIKIGYLVLLLTFAVCLLFPKIGYLFHFTYSLRYTMLLMLAMIICNSMICANTQKMNKKIFLITSIVALVLFSIVNFYFAYSLGKLQSLEFKIVLVIFLFFALYILILLKFDYSKIKKVFLSVMLLESLLFGICSIQSQKQSITDIDYLTLSDSYIEVYDALKEMDDSFYRIYIEGFNFNEATYLGIPTTSTYDSCYQYSLRDFLFYQREYPDVDWAFSVTDENVLALLNVKYIVTTPDLNQDYYFYLGEPVDLDISSDLKVYKLYESCNFVNSYQNFKKKSEIDEIANDEAHHYKHEVTNLFKDYLIVDDNLFEEFSEHYSDSPKVSFNPKFMKNNQIKIDIVTEKDIVVTLSMAYDPGWKCYIEESNEEIVLFSTQGGFATMELPAGNYSLSLSYSVPGIELGSLFSVSGVLLFICYIVNTHRKSKIKC